MRPARFRTLNHKARVATPERSAAGARRLKCPMVSEMYAGAIRPNMPPAFMTEST